MAGIPQPARIVVGSDGKLRSVVKAKPKVKKRVAPKVSKRPKLTRGTPAPRAVRSDPSADYVKGRSKAGRKTAKRLLKPTKRAPKRAIDPEFLALKREVADYEQAKRTGRTGGIPQPTTAGFDAIRLRALQGGSGGRSVGGFLRNAAAGGLDILTSVPAQAQLLAEAGLAGASTAANLATGNTSPTGIGGNRPTGLAGVAQGAMANLQQKTTSDLKAAGNAIVEDYKHRWGPLLEGDVGEFGARFYDDPTPTILDVWGGKSILGHSPNVALRATRAVAPASRVGLRADRALSRLSAPEREQFARATGKKILPGQGGRHRPPRRIVSNIARDDGQGVVGTREHLVQRPAYSNDVFARARQKAVDRAREGVGRRIERYAEARQVAPTRPGTRPPPLRQRVESRVLRGRTEEAKFKKRQKADTYEILDLYDAKEEVATARSQGGGKSAIAALKPNKTTFGQAAAGLSHEEAAFAMHAKDILGEVTNGVRQRGGKGAGELLREYVRRTRGEQIAARNAGKRTENAAEQLRVVESIPPKLVHLTDKSDPAVRRVIAAVDEARRLNANAQLRSIEAGVVRPKTVAAQATRDSAIGVGGQKWAMDEVRKVVGTYSRKRKIVDKRITAARAAGDTEKLARLVAEKAKLVKNRNARVAYIRKRAIDETPEIRKARAEGVRLDREITRLKKEAETRKVVARKARENQARMARRDREAAIKRKKAESSARLSEARASRNESPKRPALTRTFSAGSQFGRASRNLERAPKVRGRRHQPGQPTRGSDVIPMGRGKTKQPWQEYRARKQSRDLAPNAPRDRVPHPPPAPGMQRHGISAGSSRPWFNKMNAKAKQAYLRQMSQSASKADREFVKARIAEARAKAAPLSRSEEAALRKNLAAAERRAIETRVAPLKPSEAAKVSSLKKARSEHFARLKKMEDEAMGFSPPRRPQLVGKRGVYTPDRAVDVRAGYTGPRPGGRLSGPDEARRTKGRLKAMGNVDFNPALVLHQHARAMQNYTGRISRAALDELLHSAAYIDPKTGKPLTGDRLKLLSQADSERVRLVHVGNLEKALGKLDNLAEGKFLDDGTVREVFSETLPEGARASDYVAISKAAADVWTETMKRAPYYDKALTYWKGGLLALSPRWYVNNTFGLALQYGVLTGGDFRSISRASNGAIYKSLARRLEKLSPKNSARLYRKAERKGRPARAMETRTPNTVRDTMAADLTGGDVPRAIAFGFRINNRIEEFWRRSSVENRFSQALRQEGISTRGMSDATRARLLENMPESMVRNIVRDVDFFIGNYRKFSKFERTVLKRIIPFYSWLRVIARLTFALPFRSPTRALAMSVLETASTAGINPWDPLLDAYERGALQLFGHAVPTWGLNPWQTGVPLFEALGESNPVAAIGHESIGWVSPIFQFWINESTGSNNFGQGVIAPPYSAPFGQDPTNYNEVTRRPSRQPVSLPLKEAILSTAFPAQIGIIRKLASDGRTPWDTIETPALVQDWINRQMGGKRDKSLYRPVSKNKGRKPAGASTFSTIFGVPIYDQDRRKMESEARSEMQKLLEEQRDRERKRKQAKASR
jgi:hypothetical protein